MRLQASSNRLVREGLPPQFKASLIGKQQKPPAEAGGLLP
jgi:hypothetical protein